MSSDTTLENIPKIPEKADVAVKELIEKKQQQISAQYLIIKAKSNLLFYILLFLLFISIGLYIFFKTYYVENVVKPSESSKFNFKFYNHTGWSEIKPDTATCKLYSLDFVNGTYNINYDVPISDSCLDTYYVSGREGTRECLNDQCVKFNGDISIQGETETFNKNADTPFPNCSLPLCTDKLHRIISFIDNQPFCATITVDDFTSELIPEETAFLPCDLSNKNQLFRIKRLSSYGDDTKGSIMKIISRSTQKYLYISEKGVLSLANNDTQKYWVYTPTVQISSDIIMPSQLVYMDYQKLNEFTEYNPLSEEPFNIEKIPKGYDYSQVMVNLYSLSNTGYLSARQYQQFCKLEGVGNTACYHELMILTESDYTDKVQRNTLKYEYTGDL